MASPAVADVDFERDVRPIFEEHCYECHGPEKRKGGLRLTNRRDAFLPGDLGIPVIEPSSADLSPLYELLVSDDPEERMPKEKDALSPEQIETIRLWIDGGAMWPESADEDQTHWAYEPPTRPELPAVRDAEWPRNEIDAFILARLEEAGLDPAPEADRETLLRRLSFDLTGLPPSPEEVDAFLADSSADAYERLVDRLLASPRFGERWALPWLDLARYADSVGFQSDLLHTNWPYRDWVVDAINDDVPFDQFTIEQLAGDLLPVATVEQRIATGFHRSAPLNLEAGIHQEESRVQQVLDRVNTTGTVWLGSTIECAQCHNHKYDPFSQEEYYRLFAFFNNTPAESRLIGGATFLPAGPKTEIPASPELSNRRGDLLDRLVELVDTAGGLRKTDDDPRELVRSTFLQAVENGNVESASATARLLVRAATDEDVEPGDFEAWWTAMREAVLAEKPTWKPLEIVSFESTGGEDLRALRDGSVLVSGALPDTTTYTVRVRTDLSAITGLRLEMPRHPSLPGKGPGRGDATAPDFVLTELRVERERADGALEPVILDAPRASSQTPDGLITDAFDENYATGWTISNTDVPRAWANFVVDQPLGTPGETTTLRIVLDQNAGFGRTIGRVRVLATTDPPAVLRLRRQHRALLTGNEVPPSNVFGLDQLFRGTRRPEQSRRLRALSRELPHVSPEVALVMQEDEERATHLLKRGNYLTPGAEVSTGTPEVLHPMRGDLPANRLGLAHWIIDPGNPLTARVVANRWWGELFGRPLVTTPEDFGLQGEKPSHPLLLDWLAVDLVEGGWSRKALLRKLVLSATYRQSASRQDRDRDPENALLSRSARQRLPAELVRDNALAVAGLLSPKRGGPPVYPPQPDGVWKLTGSLQPRYLPSQGEDRYRRGIYTVWRRSSPYPSFVNFDAKDRTACTVQRTQTNTPLQALTLLNDSVYAEAALGLARRILSERPDAELDDRIRHGFRIATTRVPSDEEVAILRELYQSQRDLLDREPARGREITSAFDVPDDVDVRELAAWFFVSNALLNLDETIHRG